MTRATDATASDLHLLNLISELLQVLEIEHKSLNNVVDSDLGELGDRKLQLLAAFSRIKRDVANLSKSEELHRKLQELRTALDENQRTLEIHIRAVNDVADTISSAIKESDSDGTYTSTQFGVRSY
ncbi:MAG: hypothetical protein ACRBCJ_08610 [Hyphomicrobiaceae bacterium]